MHPRRKYSTSSTGIGIPSSQSKIHPIFPFSELRIAILLSDLFHTLGLRLQCATSPPPGWIAFVRTSASTTPRGRPLRYPCRCHSMEGSSSFPVHEVLILLFHSFVDGPPVTLCSFMVFACLICNHSALHPECHSPTAIKSLGTVS